MSTRYSVIGLGKLGASMAAAIASRGHDVIGVDVSAESVAAVNDGRAPVQETDLGKMIGEHKERIRATTDAAAAVAASDVTFVVVPTPSDERGAFSIEFAARAFDAIGAGLRDKAGYHLVVLTSTVLPGSLRYGLVPRIERASGKKCGVDFGVCYSPAFIALGSVIRDFMNPDFVLIGESDARAGEMLETCYGSILQRNAAIKRMSIENAELTKLAVNTFVTTKITFANMLADLCERIPGGDVDVVTDALGMDRRIGRAYLTGALGYGGPCFPRDNQALSFFAEMTGTHAALADTTDSYNRGLAERVLARVRPLLGSDETVAILGLAYKPATHVVDESQGIFLARTFAADGIKVIAHDPLAGATARAVLGDSVELVDDLETCIRRADVIVITNPDPAYRSLDALSFNHRSRPPLVIDFWRILADTVGADAAVRYVPAGRSVDDAANAARLEQLWSPA